MPYQPASFLAGVWRLHAVSEHQTAKKNRPPALVSDIVHTIGGHRGGAATPAAVGTPPQGAMNPRHPRGLKIMYFLQIMLKATQIN